MFSPADAMHTRPALVCFSSGRTSSSKYLAWKACES